MEKAIKRYFPIFILLANITMGFIAPFLVEVSCPSASLRPSMMQCLLDFPIIPRFFQTEPLSIPFGIRHYLPLSA